MDAPNDRDQFESSLLCPGDSRQAALLVSAVRNFAAMVRACMLAGAPRERALKQANADTLQLYGVDVLARAGVGDLLVPSVARLAEAQSNVGAFADELLSGALQVQLRPALAMDVATLYRSWCERQGCIAFAFWRVIRTLVRNYEIDGRRTRYIDGGVVTNPQSILFLGGPCELIRLSKDPLFCSKTWLGQQIALFRANVAAYSAVKR